jgi:hypothetical protein
MLSHVLGSDSSCTTCSRIYGRRLHEFRLRLRPLTRVGIFHSLRPCSPGSRQGLSLALRFQSAFQVDPSYKPCAHTLAPQGGVVTQAIQSRIQSLETTCIFTKPLLKIPKFAWSDLHHLEALPPLDELNIYLLDFNSKQPFEQEPGKRREYKKH